MVQNALVRSILSENDCEKFGREGPPMAEPTQVTKHVFGIAD